MHINGAIVLLLIILIGCGGGGGDSSSVTQPPAADTATVLAANDLGMHCMDREFSVFSILPPFNVVNAQVLLRDSNGRPYVADDTEVEVFYDDVADASGSINSYSIGKTDFWSYANALFGVTLPEGQGLTGLYMPADDPQVRGSQPMEYSLDKEMVRRRRDPHHPHRRYADRQALPVVANFGRGRTKWRNHRESGRGGSGGHRNRLPELPPNRRDGGREVASSGQQIRIWKSRARSTF